MTWATGEVVRFRYIRDGRAFWTLPATVTADDREWLALWIAPGSPMRRPDPPRMPIPQLAAGEWQAVETSWVGEGILMLRRPDETKQAIWLFWYPNGRFRGWYVNLEDWWRDRDGVDAYDHQLDITVDPDGTWHWKDESDLAESVETGIFTLEQADAIRAEGERVIAGRPWPTGWENWKPDPAWPVPELSEGWDEI